MFDALIFDLDDTLYVESDFVASGYRAVARHVADRQGVDCRDVFYAMMATYVSAGRDAVMQMVVKRFLNSAVKLADLVQVYREHEPRIRLFPGYAGVLLSLRARYRLGIVTDGLPEVQQRKVGALGLGSVVEHIVYTWEYGPENEKPDPLGFLMILKQLDVAPSRSLYVGDNAYKDCRGAHNAGMKAATIQYSGLTGWRSVAAEPERPEIYLNTLFQLPRILQGLEDYES